MSVLQSRPDCIIPKPAEQLPYLSLGPLSPSSSGTRSFSFFLWQRIAVELLLSLWLSMIFELFTAATALPVAAYCQIDFSCLRGRHLTILLDCLFVACVAVPFGTLLQFFYTNCVPEPLSNYSSSDIILGVPSFTWSNCLKHWIKLLTWQIPAK